ncbi:MAG: rhomboid family intramembrane serine protease [Dehalococcoidales bacterium]
MRLSETLGFRLTPVIVLVLVNLLFFLVTYFVEVTYETLGFYRGGVSSRPWAVFTGMFLYRDFWNYLGNMIPLFFLGTMLMREVGNSRFLTVYFVGGLVGNLVYFLIAMLSEGYFGSRYLVASGGVFAIGGVLMAIMGRTPVRLLLIPSAIPLYVVVLIFLLLLSLVRLASWEVHLVGLAFGLAFGHFYQRRRVAWRW